MNLFDTMLSGRERYVEALAEHTQIGINRILNVSSKGPQQPMPGTPALVEGPSPTDSPRTAGAITPAQCSKCGPSCICNIAWNE